MGSSRAMSPYATDKPSQPFPQQPPTKEVAVKMRKKGQKKGSLLGFIGAGITMADMASDVVMIANYSQRGKHWYALAMIVTICFNLLVQIVWTILQNWRKGVWEICKELLFLLTLVSPGVLAYRVSTGEEQSSTDLFSPQMIMIICKTIDVAFEAIPGLIIQLHAQLSLSGSSTSTFSYVSIALSTATIAFGAVMIFYDKDTSEACRKMNPSFYGAFPDGGAARARTFLVLMVFTMCHVFSKCLGLTLLWVALGGPFALGMWAADLALYFLVKIVQCDFFYWVAVDSLFGALIVSTLARIGNKIMVDFTGLL
jgi:hypothetical protein